MQLVIVIKIARITLLSLLIILLPLTCMGYVQGDINSDDQIGLQESIYALQVAAGATIPLSGTTINVPADIPTIQQAIDAASNGDTINIAAGTYVGALTISGKILALAGAGSGSTIIDGGTAHAISIEHSPGVSITNLTVQNGAKGIYANNNSHVAINQIAVQNCTDRGVEIDTNSSGEIRDSTINNNGRDGLGVLRNSNVYLAGVVTINDNTRYGLQLILGSTALIDGSTFTSSGNDNSGISAVYNSSLYVNNSSLSLRTNTVYGLHVSGSSSLGISNGSSVTNETSGEIGIAVYGGSRLYSEGAITIRGSGTTGLEAAGACDVTLKGDVLIDHSGATGFFINRTSAAYIAAKLEVLNTVGYGIAVTRSSSFETKDSANVIVKGTLGDGVGIDIGDCSVLRAQGGTFEIKDNVGFGIEVGRNSTLDLRQRGNGLNVTINGNSRGINLYEQGSLRTDAVVSITGNSGDGINLSGGSEASLKNISILNNNGWGISANDGAGINVSGSTIQSNGPFLRPPDREEYDIALGFGARSSIYSSTIGTPLACDSSVISRSDDVNDDCP
jgi:hypothetical protein